MSEDQLQPDDTLDDRGVDDVLDEGISPPEKPRGSFAHGTTPAEAQTNETIDERLPQEEPEDQSILGGPETDPETDPETGPETDPEMDPEDGLEEEPPPPGAVGDERSGRLLAPDEGVHEDAEPTAVAEDVGIDGAGASAEEAAMHEAEPPD